MVKKKSRENETRPKSSAKRSVKKKMKHSVKEPVKQPVNQSRKGSMSALKKEDLQITLEIERSRLLRQESMFVMNKSLVMFFVFMFAALLGFSANHISRGYFNLLLIMGMIVVIIGFIPYLSANVLTNARIKRLIEKIEK